MMNSPLFYMHLGFLEWCCVYSSLDCNSNITYYVDPSSYSPKLISPFFCYYIVFCSCLHYNIVYFNYLLLYLKKSKWLSEEALQIAVKRREMKSKGEKKRYTHLNAEFQRIARRDKKTFLSDQCKKIEENNRMRKTKDLFQKIRDTKGTFHAKMGSIKDRKGMDLTESEDIKKRWQEYTEELYKKDLHDPDNHEVVITHTHLEPDILECEVRWALGSITMNKDSGGDGIPVELFQILKDDAVKVLHSICQQIGKTHQWPHDWKRSVFIPIPRKAMPKNAQTTAQLHSSYTLVSNSQNSPSQASAICEP